MTEPRCVRVELPAGGYDILIGDGLLATAGSRLAALCKGRLAVVSDETVWALHGAALATALDAAGLGWAPILLPPGEGSKTLASLEQLLGRFAAAGLDRQGLVAAFGGGVVGDLAGFAAASWMRGVDYVQLPTTLLAQVDSSVGGKTGVNLAAGKNLAGAFHQPRLVLADTALLSTLPPREQHCGMAEMIKYGALFSEELFVQLAGPRLARPMAALVEACCAWKAEMVRADEKEAGRRMLLNFGHSFGHAIEKLGAYTRHNHGEAVAMGMVLAARFGQRTGFTRQGCASRLEQALAARGLPTACPYGPAELFEAMGLDKKSRDGGLNLILLRDIGQGQVQWQPMETIKTILTEVA